MYQEFTSIVPELKGGLDDFLNCQLNFLSPLWFALGKIHSLSYLLLRSIPLGFPHNGEESYPTALVPGTSIDIPVGTKFQYRNVSDAELKFICIAMLP